MYPFGKKDYELLPVNDESLDDVSRHRPSQQRVRRTLTPALLLALTLSLAINGLVLVLVVHPRFAASSAASCPQDRSTYAHLDRRKPVRMAESTPYSGHDFAASRRLWEEINIDNGMIALPDSLSHDLSLPEAQRFPWDENKGIYFLNGFHNMHCLRSIHIALMEFHFNEPQSRRFEHVLHCMDSLRQDIICNADDTPRYTDSSDTPESGVGQVRMCRDWEALTDWAKGYNACFSFTNQTASGFEQVLRYSHCPQGSEYEASVREAFARAGRELP